MPGHPACATRTDGAGVLGAAHSSSSKGSRDLRPRTLQRTGRSGDAAGVERTGTDVPDRHPRTHESDRGWCARIRPWGEVFGPAGLPSSPSRRSSRRRPRRRGSVGAGLEPLIGCGHAAERVTVTVSSRLDGRCTYTGGFDITASHVTLDCRGALVLGSGDDGRSGVAVSVAATSDLEDVTIRNCRIQGFEHGIDLARNAPTQLAPGHEYDHHLRDVVIEDDRISGAHGVGIYVHPYVTDTTVRHDVVTGSGSTAIYLDEGSRGAHIEGDVIAGNGSHRERAGRSQHGLRWRHRPLLGPRPRSDRGGRLARQRHPRQLDRRELGRRRVPLHELRRERAQRSRRLAGPPLRRAGQRRQGQRDLRQRHGRVGGFTHGRERVPDGLQRCSVRVRRAAVDHARPGAATTPFAAT